MSSLCNLKCLQIAVQSTVCGMSDKYIYNHRVLFITEFFEKVKHAFIPLTLV